MNHSKRLKLQACGHPVMCMITSSTNNLFSSLSTKIRLLISSGAEGAYPDSAWSAGYEAVYFTSCHMSV